MKIRLNQNTNNNENIEDNHLTADARLPSGMNKNGATLKFGSSLCRKAEPSSSITYLKNIQENVLFK